MGCTVRRQSRALAAFAFVLLAAAPFAACVAPSRAAAADAPPPEQWVGRFAGQLYAFADGKPRALTRMQLEVGAPGADGRQRFAITYGDGERAQLRDYQLVTVDAARGRYAIDERDGIVLDATFADGALISAFTAGGQTLVARYVWDGDRIAFELESYVDANAHAAGSGVRSHRELTVQRAELLRQ